MMRYKVYFQICGKKMVKSINADNQQDAQNKILEELKIDKIMIDENDAVEFLSNMFGFKK